MTNRAALEASVLDGMDSACSNVMQWGKDDCTLWVANIIRDALGYDPAAWYRGRFSSRFGAAKLIAANGGIIGTIRKAARQHNWIPVEPRLAQPGDVGLIWTELNGSPIMATAVCRSRGWFVSRNERGFTAIRAADVALAWSVLDDVLTRQSVAPITAGRLMPQPVHEPVSTIIGLTALIGGTFGVSTVVAGAIGGFLVSTAISVGLSIASSFLQPQRGTGSGSGNYGSTDAVSQRDYTSKGVQITQRDSLPYKQVVLGKSLVAGAVFFEACKPPYLTTGYLLSYGKVDAVERIRIATNDLKFTSIPENLAINPIALDGQPAYATNFSVSVRYGSDDQAIDGLLHGGYPSIGAEFRQRGNATAVCEYKFGGTTQEDFIAVWGNVSRPPTYFFVRGAQVYDPRDPVQDINDETTWKWSNNATLCQAFYITRPWGGRIPMSKVRWDKIAESADYDDTVIACKDGTLIKRHTIDGVITLNQKPFDVMPQLLTANRGLLLESSGRVWIQSSQPRSPVVTIHDRVITSGIKYQSAKGKSELINRVQVRAVAPNQDYQFVDGPILDDTDLQSADGEIFTGTLALNYTLDDSANWTRVQRLQQCYLRTSRLGRTLTVSVDTEVLAIASDELLGNVVTFASELFSPANRDYLVTGVGFTEDFTGLVLALTEYDATIETEWNPTTDEQDFTLPPLDIS